MSSGKDEQILNAITERAADWYVRHREGGLSSAEKEEFLGWLRASLQHTSEYLAVARLSGGFREAIEDLGLEQSELFERTGQEQSQNIATWRARPRKSRSIASTRRALAIGIAATLFAVALGLYWIAAPGIPGLPKSITVERGEQRTVQLSDGSVLHVNAGSRLWVRYSRSQRLVELDHGQALFEVARDSKRPFHVRTGSTDVVAVGTQFEVYRRDSREVTVTVVQGKVDVIEDVRASNVDVMSHPSTAPYPVRISAGQQVRLNGTAERLKAEPADVNVATAWLRREIVFDGRQLGEVTNEFNRYIPVPIEIEDASLRDLKVTGSFNAYDSDSFIDFLRQYDVEVEQGVGIIHVRRKR